MGELREALATPPEFRVLTTGQAAETFGYSADTWREWAAAGDVRGAYRDDGEGMWRLPAKACEEHLARLQARALHRRRKRGPWEASETAQTLRAGSEGVPDGTVVAGGPKTLEFRKADAPKSGSSRLAPAGRAHGRPRGGR